MRQLSQQQKLNIRVLASPISDSIRQLKTKFILMKSLDLLFLPIIHSSFRIQSYEVKI